MYGIVNVGNENIRKQNGGRCDADIRDKGDGCAIAPIYIDLGRCVIPIGLVLSRPIFPQ